MQVVSVIYKVQTPNIARIHCFTWSYSKSEKGHYKLSVHLIVPYLLKIWLVLWIIISPCVGPVYAQLFFISFT